MPKEHLSSSPCSHSLLFRSIGKFKIQRTILLHSPKFRELFDYILQVFGVRAKTASYFKIPTRVQTKSDKG